MIHIGASGWVYRHWSGCFYPPEMKQRDWLEHYARHWSTVEINRSFYRLPSRKNFENWAERVRFRPGFVFAVKASRYLTHIKKLYDPEEPLRRLMDAAYGLGDTLGPILYQLPPTMRVDPERLRYFVSKLPPGTRSAFEFRDNSWYTDEIYHILNEADCALVRAVGGHYTPIEVPDTGSWRYIRVHGGQWGIGLSEGELQFWADRIAGDAYHGRDVYLYFNNDPECHAIYNGYRIREMLAHTGQVV
jgi:uncharacterized protein YecE (DUF72 family)